MNRESVEAHALGAIGAIGGAFKYYVQPELTAKRAWTALGVGIALYELCAPQGELLSEQYDRWLDNDRTRAIALGGAVITCAHLINALPPRVDPLHQITRLGRGNVS